MKVDLNIIKMKQVKKMSILQKNFIGLINNPIQMKKNTMITRLTGKLKKLNNSSDKENTCKTIKSEKFKISRDDQTKQYLDMKK